MPFLFLPASWTLVPSQVLYSFFATSIQAAPGSYHSPSLNLPTTAQLPSSPQPDSVSLANQLVIGSLPIQCSFFPFSPLCFQFPTGLSSKFTPYHACWWRWRGLQDSWGYNRLLPSIQAPGIAPGLLSAALPWKTRLLKRTRMQHANWRQNTLTFYQQHNSKTWSAIYIWPTKIDLHRESEKLPFSHKYHMPSSCSSRTESTRVLCSGIRQTDGTFQGQNILFLSSSFLKNGWNVLAENNGGKKPHFSRQLNSTFTILTNI